MADAGWEPLVAETVREAKRVLARNHLNAAVIDAELADGSGVELGLTLQQMIPGLPVVIMGAVAGGCGFPVLASPCKPVKVMTALRNSFSRRAA